MPPNKAQTLYLFTEHCSIYSEMFSCGNLYHQSKAQLNFSVLNWLNYLFLASGFIFTGFCRHSPVNVHADATVASKMIFIPIILGT